MPVLVQNPAGGSDVGFHEAVGYSLISPPRMVRRRIRSVWAGNAPAAILTGQTDDQLDNLVADRRTTRRLRLAPLVPTSRLCQRSNVPGVTIRWARSVWGRIRDTTASTARSCQASRGLGFARRSTATSWRKTSTSYLGILRRRRPGRAHMAKIGSRWRKLPAARIALLVLAVLRHDQRAADLAGANAVSASTINRWRDELLRCWPPAPRAWTGPEEDRCRRRRGRPAGRHPHPCLMFSVPPGFDGGLRSRD